MIKSKKELYQNTEDCHYFFFFDFSLFCAPLPSLISETFFYCDCSYGCYFFCFLALA